MNLRRALGVAAGLVLIATGVVGFGQPASAAPFFATPTTCTIQTVNTGNFLTAVGGGGRTTDVLHTNATVARSWEAFTLVDAGDGVHVGIRTLTGNLLTAVGGGGRTTDVIHSDATQVQSWELFRFNCGQTFVPNVLSFDDQSARNTINAAGLTVGQITFDNRCINPGGTVELQNPTGGALVSRGTAVSLREDAPGCVGM